MAAANLGDELLCSICLSTLTDPVTLACGHNFCRGCSDRVLNTQEKPGVYSCPKCREEFQQRPAQTQNMSLQKVSENIGSTQPQKEVPEIYCTYCLHSPVPAVRSCLHCEASLCDSHLKAHKNSEEHVLTEPGTSIENRRCSVHKELLKYYCTKDAICICVSCTLAGVHRGHQVEMLDEASEKMKMKLRNVLENLNTKREDTEERVQSVEERRRKAQEKSSEEAGRVNALFTDLRGRLDDLEKRVLSEISRKEKLLSLSMSDVIEKLEKKKDQLSKKMRHIEELCNMADPLTVLQGPSIDDLCDAEEDGGDEDTEGHDTTHDVDVDAITRMLHAGLSNIMTYLHTVAPLKPKRKRPHSPSVQSPPSHTKVSLMSGTKYGDNGEIVSTGSNGGLGDIYGEGPADILLDENTAGNNLLISDDLKTATWTNVSQNYPDTEERFAKYQVMSSQGFSSGRHYWDVEISRSGLWRVGMCYPSIDRWGGHSYIGHNNKSWSLCRDQENNFQYLVIHNGEEIQLPDQISSNRVRVCLDYEAGRLSFYELGDPYTIHLHTFTTTFTEPLHASLYVMRGYIKISGGPQVGEMEDPE
ncbi:E3 ubiquitin/ISG15 ligase TRIM25-like [Dendropsophus ebraccatus]|uniref:E3 ubiquitin/ISG15 ligase TRIM25-like n=1 Tax=Dendropsophus ebraccatus TaxID=150705 RepID=UPI003831F2D6